MKTLGEGIVQHLKGVARVNTSVLAIPALSAFLLSSPLSPAFAAPVIGGIQDQGGSASAPAGQPNVLQIFGSGFVPDPNGGDLGLGPESSIVLIGGNPLSFSANQFVGPSQINVSVPGSMMTTPSISVAVRNPDGSQSTATNFPVSAPRGTVTVMVKNNQTQQYSPMNGGNYGLAPGGAVSFLARVVDGSGNDIQGITCNVSYPGGSASGSTMPFPVLIQFETQNSQISVSACSNGDSGTSPTFSVTQLSVSATPLPQGGWRPTPYGTVSLAVQPSGATVNYFGSVAQQAPNSPPFPCGNGQSSGSGTSVNVTGGNFYLWPCVFDNVTGNSFAPSTPLNYQSDGAKPVIGQLTPAADTTGWYNLRTGNQVVVNVTDSESGIAQLRVSYDGNQTIVPQNGQLAVQHPITLTRGNHTLDIEATDLSGQDADPKSFSPIKYDDDKPDVCVQVQDFGDNSTYTTCGANSPSGRQLKGPLTVTAYSGDPTSGVDETVFFAAGIVALSANGSDVPASSTLNGENPAKIWNIPAPTSRTDYVVSMANVRDVAGNPNSLQAPISFSIVPPQALITDLQYSPNPPNSPSTVGLTWTQPGNAGQVTSYRIVHAADLGNPIKTVNGTLPSPPLQVDLSAAPKNASGPYGYAGNNLADLLIQTCINTACSYSNRPNQPVWTLAKAPGTPTGVAISGNPNGATISFNSGGNSPVTEYFYNFTSPSGNFCAGLNPPQGQTACTPVAGSPDGAGNITLSVQTGLKPNTQYQAAVAAQGKQGDLSPIQTGNSFCTEVAKPTGGPTGTINGNTLTVDYAGDPNPSSSPRRLKVSLQSNLSSPMYDQPFSGTSASVPNIVAGKTYYMGITVQPVQGCSTTPQDSPITSVASPFSAPQSVSVLDNQATATSFVVQVTPKAGETPRCAYIQFTGPGGAQTKIGSLPGGSGNIVVDNLALANGQYTGIRASVGGSDDCSDAINNPTTNAPTPAFTRPAIPDLPGTQSTTPTSVTVTFNYNVSNDAGTQNAVEYWQAADCGSEPASFQTTQPPQAIPTATQVVNNLTTDLPYCFRTLTIAKHNAPSWNVKSPAKLAYPGTVPYSDPTVTIDKTVIDSANIVVRITPRNGDKPDQYIAEFKSLIDATVKNKVTTIFPADGSFHNVTLVTPISNSSYTITGAVGLSTKIGKESNMVPANNNPAWTKPEAPTEAFASIATDLTSLTVTAINFPPANFAGTQYEVQAVANDPNNFQIVGNIRRSGKFTAGQTIPAITNLTSNTPYYIRTYVYSASGDPALDVWVMAPNPVVTAPPSARGHLVSTSTDTVTAYWDTVDTNGVQQLLAVANGPGGATNVGASDTLFPPYAPFPSALPNISVRSLPISNTSYTLLLQKVTGPTQIAFYPNSDVVGITTAYPPDQPTAQFSGNASNVQIAISFGPAPERNASDSQYSVLIKKNGSPMYLDGVGGLVSSPVLKTRAQWENTSGALTLQNAGLQNDYEISICVRQKSPNATVCSTALSKKTPGSTVDVTYPAINGADYDRYIFGVNRDGGFKATFSVDMNPASFPGKVKLIDKETGAEVPLDFANAYDSATQSLTIKPQTQLLPVHQYRLDFLAGLQDFLNIGTTPALPSKEFITGINPGAVTNAYSPYDTQKAAGVQIDAGQMTSTSFPVLRIQPFIQPPNPVTVASALVDQALSNNRALREVRRVELLFFNQGTSGTPVQGDASKKIKLIMKQTGGAGALSKVGSAVDEASLDIYYIDNSQNPPRLVLADSKSVKNGGTVTALVQKSGTYVLAGQISTDLGGAVAYPVPFKPSAGHTFIKFDGLATDSTVKVFTIMGELVKKLHNDANETRLDWNVKNEDGEPVASGVYLYQIKNPYSEKRGKLIIIR